MSVQLNQPTSRHEQVLLLDLTPLDDRGNQQDPVSVEVRSSELRDQASAFQRVRVTGEWRDGLLRAKEIINVDAGARIRARGLTPLRLRALRFAAAGLVSLGFVGFAASNSILPTFQATTVPQVHGLAAADAANRLHDAGFTVVHTETRPDASLPAGRVIDTLPPGGLSWGKRSPITVLVSSGGGGSAGGGELATGVLGWPPNRSEI